MTPALRSVLSFALLTSLSAILHAQDSQNLKQPAATISGTVLTLADLQAKEGGKLLQAQYQYYLSERKALEEAIDTRLLEQEAGLRHISLDDLLQAEVYKNVKDPTEDQLQVYYEGLDTQDSYASVRNEVLEHIRDLRRTKARAAYVEKLRNQAQIHILLEPPSADVKTANSFVQGARTAPVVLVEFADYQCPYCQKVNPQIQRLKKEFGDSLSVVYKDFPLPMHHGAQKAAEAARCAGQQGKFWEYHDVLFYSNELSTDGLKEHARVLKLNSDRFNECLDNGTEAEAVKSDLTEAKSLGLTGTPSFFVNGHFFSGVVEYAALKDIINQQLNAVAAKKPMLSEKKAPEPLSH